jgi:hypothetical protein
MINASITSVAGYVPTMCTNSDLEKLSATDEWILRTELNNDI